MPTVAGNVRDDGNSAVRLVSGLGDGDLRGLGQAQADAAALGVEIDQAHDGLRTQMVGLTAGAAEAGITDYRFGVE